MSKFKELVQEANEILLEQPPMGMGGLAPPPPDTGGGLPPPPGPVGSALPGMEGGAPEEGPEEMDNETKKEADPSAYTEETLANLVDFEAGISPEMFSDWIDTFGIGAAKIQDKDGFKKFYRDFYERLQLVMETKEELKRIFDQLHGTLKDVISTQKNEPDTAKGGVGMAGPAGPGVK